MQNNTNYDLISELMQSDISKPVRNTLEGLVIVSGALDAEKENLEHLRYSLISSKKILDSFQIYVKDKDNYDAEELIFTLYNQIGFPVRYAEKIPRQLHDLLRYSIKIARDKQTLGLIFFEGVGDKVEENIERLYKFRNLSSKLEERTRNQQRISLKVESMFFARVLEKQLRKRR